MRLFVAIPLPEPYREALRRRVAPLQDQWNRTGAKINWVPASHYHLTLKFLGECEEARSFAGALAGAAQQTRAFTWTMTRLGCFPTRGKPAVLWAGAQEPACSAVHERVEAALQPLGFLKENRPFFAHVTVARIKDAGRNTGLRENLDRVAFFPLGPIPMREIELVQSVLTPQGSVYTRLQNFPLGGG